MNISFRSASPSVGRFTAVILTLVVIVCVSMIGATAYLKFQMDRAETLLVAPDAAVGSDQEMFDRLRRVLGYGGFTGLAQNYVAKHDTSGFADMKSDIKAADDIVAHMPEKTPAESRHDLSAIVTSFDNALQKLNAPAGEGDFTAADLTPLYAALPILDARVASANAETRLTAQTKMQFWGMLLTLVSWCSLIIASACAAGIYLTLRDKQSAPMRALAQSIQNMARGDMRTAIWGTERQDMIGELARAVDVARYHFSHLPDLSLLSEQGPVRMRFEGGSRSLFEAMMKAISRDSENIREQTLTLADAVTQQRESITLLSEKVEAILQNILDHGHDGDQQIRQAITEMVSSAENLKNAHAHAADQLSRLVPHIQDRATGMAEIAQITGKQVAQTLQSLTLSEINLKANAEQAKDTLTKLSSTADDLGTRLFGAINLLQASGKILAETTENIQGRTPGETVNPSLSAVTSFDSIAPVAKRIEEIALQLSEMQAALGAQIEHAATAAAIVHPLVLSNPEDGVIDQNATSLLMLSATAEQLRHGQSAFAASLAQIQAQLEGLSQSIDQHSAISSGESDIANNKFDLALLSGFEQLLSERVDPKFASLEENIAQKSLETAELTTSGVAETQSKISDMQSAIAAEMQSRFDVLASDIAQHAGGIIDQNTALSLTTRESMNALGEKINGFTVTMPDELRQGLLSDWQRMVSQMETVQSNIERHAEQQKRDIIDHNNFVSMQTREPVIDLGDKFAAFAMSLPTELRASIQPEGANVAAHIAELQSSIERQTELYKQDMLQHRTAIASDLSEPITLLDAKISAFASNLPTDIRHSIHQETENLAAKISVMHANIENHADHRKNEILEHVSGMQQSVLAPFSGLTATVESLPNAVREGIQIDLNVLQSQMSAATGDFSALSNQNKQEILDRTEILSGQISTMHGELDNVGNQRHEAVIEQIGAFSNGLRDTFMSVSASLPMTVRENFEADFAGLKDQMIAMKSGFESLSLQHKQEIFEHTSILSSNLRKPVAELGERIVTLSSVMPTEIRSGLQADWQRLIGQIAALQSALETSAVTNRSSVVDHTTALFDRHQAAINAVTAQLSGLPAELRHTVGGDLQTLSGQVDSIRATQEQMSIATSPRLSALEEAIHAQTAEIVAQTTAASGQARQALIELADKVTDIVYTLPPEIRGQMEADWKSLSVQIDNMDRGFEQLFLSKISPELASIESSITQQVRSLVDQSKMASDLQRSQMTALTGKLADVAEALPNELRARMQQDWSTISVQIDTFRSGVEEALSERIFPELANIGSALSAQTRSLTDATYMASSQTRDSVSELGQKLVEIASRLPASVREKMEEDWAQLALQIDDLRGSFEQTIAEKVTPELHALQANASQHARIMSEQSQSSSHQTRNHVAELTGKLLDLTETMSNESQKQMRDDWSRISSQIDATRGEFGQALASHIDPKLSSIVADVGSLHSSATATIAHLTALKTTSNANIVELNAVQSAVQATGAEVASLSRAVSGVAGDVAIVQTIAQGTGADLASVSRAVSDVASEINALQAGSQITGSEVAAVSRAVQSMAANVSSDLGALHAVSQTTGAEVSSVSRALNGLSTSVSSDLSAIHAVAQNTGAEVASVARTLQNVSTSVSSDLGALHAMGQTTGAEVSGISRTLQGVASNVSTVQSTTTSTAADVVALHSTANATVADIRIVQNSLNANAIGISALQGVTEAVRQNVDATKQHVASVGEDIAALYGNVEATKQVVTATHKLSELTQEELAKPAPPLTYILPPELQQQMHDHWYQMAAQIEASRASVDRLFSEQVASRMDAFQQALTDTRSIIDKVREEFMQPHKSSFALPPELQQQMHDHWFQVETQIEASRASLVETISHQVEKMESRLAGRATSSLARTANDYATQRQIEQQTQILSELVSTLGVLDAHMQQIKVEMHHGIGRA